jgi:hypothetical protein
MVYGWSIAESQGLSVEHAQLWAGLARTPRKKQFRVVEAAAADRLDYPVVDTALEQ